MKTITSLAFTLLSSPLFATIQLSSVPLEQIGKIAQFDLNEQGELIVINRKGELWQANKKQKLADNLATDIAISARYDRIASGDKKGNFFLWTETQQYTSSIPLAKNAKMLPLAFATIAVTKQNGQYKLARIEPQGEKAIITAVTNDEVLPDARPLQINFSDDNHTQGHIAVLAKPDAYTYLHGVLGDAIEAQEIQYLERHTLKPLVEKVRVNGLVFEANQLEIWHTPKPKLISVMSGNGDGARTVVIGLHDNKLIIESQSHALPSNRWQSPFSFNGKLYAVQMPHLRMRLVEYLSKGDLLNEQFITDGLSNHAYGDYETNLVASTSHFTLIPQAGYRSVAILDRTNKLEKLSTRLPAEIIQTKASHNAVYLLLNNGEIWIANDK